MSPLSGGQFEIESIKAVYDGNKEKALMAAGEAAQRINDLPKVSEMVQGVVKDAENILRNIPKKFLS
jgi:enoyl-[acyl-carrier protein] reductase II